MLKTRLGLAYLRISDDALDHPKLSGLSDGAHRFWFNVNCWCQKHLTNGHVPKTSLRDIPRFKASRVRELVTAGLWRSDGAEYRVHDFLVHNDSRELVEERRKKKTKRMETWRERRRELLVAETVDALRDAPVDRLQDTPRARSEPSPSPHLTSPQKRDTQNVSLSRAVSEPGMPRRNARIQNEGDPVPLWDWQFSKFSNGLQPKFGAAVWTETMAWVHRVGDELTNAGAPVDVSDPVKWWDARYAADWGRSSDDLAAFKALGKAAK